MAEQGSQALIEAPAAKARLSLIQQVRNTVTHELPRGWYAAFREALRIVIPYGLRRRGVRLVRSRLGLLNLAARIAAHLPRKRLDSDLRRIPRQEVFFESLTLVPRPTEEEAAAIVARPVTPPRAIRADVICFSIVDWSFRYQRPQQIMAQFAAHGHRVFYVSVSRFTSAHARSKFSIREIKENIFEVRIASYYGLDIFREVISGKDLRLTLASLDELRRECNINEAIGYVMVPSWARVALETRRQWGWRVIYDCMDEWETFPGIKEPLLSMERDLVRDCDYLVVTAQRLYDKWQSFQRPMILARNATDYDFFDEGCRPNPLLSDVTHPIVGYFGAVADWFDLELLAYVAEQRPAYTFVIIGGIFNLDVSRVRSLANVRFLGQQAYETMPQYLYHFDACLIPFKINRITEATDPVKLYEYLSGGKPIVSVKLPELKHYEDFLYLAEDYSDFVAKLDSAIAENDPELRARRKKLAREHTWEERYERIYQGFVQTVPRASIIVSTHNELAMTRLCLESVFRNTEYPNFEVIVVDNNSSDGTSEYLSRMAKVQSNLTCVLNSENHGLARAYDQGIEVAKSGQIVLLKNDAVVPPGWLSRLLFHVQNPNVGLVSPVTNYAASEANVEVKYCSWSQMTDFAHDYVWTRHRQTKDIRALHMSCVGMRRDVYDQVGPFATENEDYSHRVRKQGYGVVCAADVFVHHFGEGPLLAGD